MDVLSHMKCIPCRAGDPKLTGEDIAAMQAQVPAWHVIEHDGEQRLERSFTFANFAQALAFSSVVGRLAEQEDHHPVITTAWGKVTVTWWTHAIGGLHRNDFIMAAQTDDAYREAP